MELQTIANGIYTLNSFLSNNECETQIAISEEQGYEYATFGGTDNRQTAMPGFRNNHRVFYESMTLASEFWSRCRETLPRFVDCYETIGIGEKFRFYRYEQGQFFGRHPDGPQRRKNGERSRLSFIVYLNDNYEGGETIFDHAAIEPKTGMALVFQHGLMHEGAEILSGRKYVLRSDVMCAAEPFDIEDGE